MAAYLPFASSVARGDPADCVYGVSSSGEWGWAACESVLEVLDLRNGRTLCAFDFALGLPVAFAVQSGGVGGSGSGGIGASGGVLNGDGAGAGAGAGGASLSSSSGSGSGAGGSWGSRHSSRASLRVPGRIALVAEIVVQEPHVDGGGRGLAVCINTGSSRYSTLALFDPASQSCLAAFSLFHTITSMLPLLPNSVPSSLKPWQPIHQSQLVMGTSRGRIFFLKNLIAKAPPGKTAPIPPDAIVELGPPSGPVATLTASSNGVEISALHWFLSANHSAAFLAVGFASGDTHVWSAFDNMVPQIAMKSLGRVRFFADVEPEHDQSVQFYLFVARDSNRDGSAPASLLPLAITPQGLVSEAMSSPLLALPPGSSFTSLSSSSGSLVSGNGTRSQHRCICYSFRVPTPDSPSGFSSQAEILNVNKWVDRSPPSQLIRGYGRRIFATAHALGPDAMLISRVDWDTLTLYSPPRAIGMSEDQSVMCGKDWIANESVRVRVATLSGLAVVHLEGQQHAAFKKLGEVVPRALSTPNTDGQIAEVLRDCQATFIIYPRMPRDSGPGLYPLVWMVALQGGVMEVFRSCAEHNAGLARELFEWVQSEIEKVKERLQDQSNNASSAEFKSLARALNVLRSVLQTLLQSSLTSTLTEASRKRLGVAWDGVERVCKYRDLVVWMGQRQLSLSRSVLGKGLFIEGLLRTLGQGGSTRSLKKLIDAVLVPSANLDRVCAAIYYLLLSTSPTATSSPAAISFCTTFSLRQEMRAAVEALWLLDHAQNLTPAIVGVLSRSSITLLPGQDGHILRRLHEQGQATAALLFLRARASALLAAEDLALGVDIYLQSRHLNEAVALVQTARDTRTRHQLLHNLVGRACALGMRQALIAHAFEPADEGAVEAAMHEQSAALAIMFYLLRHRYAEAARVAAEANNPLLQALVDGHPSLSIALPKVPSGAIPPTPRAPAPRVETVDVTRAGANILHPFARDALAAAATTTTTTTTTTTSASGLHAPLFASPSSSTYSAVPSSLAHAMDAAATTTTATASTPTSTSIGMSSPPASIHAPRTAPVLPPPTFAAPPTTPLRAAGLRAPLDVVAPAVMLAADSPLRTVPMATGRERTPSPLPPPSAAPKSILRQESTPGRLRKHVVFQKGLSPSTPANDSDIFINPSRVVMLPSANTAASHTLSSPLSPSSPSKTISFSSAAPTTTTTTTTSSLSVTELVELSTATDDAKHPMAVEHEAAVPAASPSIGSPLKDGQLRTPPLPVLPVSPPKQFVGTPAPMRAPLVTVAEPSPSISVPIVSFSPFSTTTTTTTTATGAVAPSTFLPFVSSSPSSTIIPAISTSATTATTTTTTSSTTSSLPSSLTRPSASSTLVSPPKSSSPPSRLDYGILSAIDKSSLQSTTTTTTTASTTTTAAAFLNPTTTSAAFSSFSALPTSFVPPEIVVVPPTGGRASEGAVLVQRSKGNTDEIEVIDVDSDEDKSGEEEKMEEDHQVDDAQAMEADEVIPNTSASAVAAAIDAAASTTATATSTTSVSVATAPSPAPASAVAAEAAHPEAGWTPIVVQSRLARTPIIARTISLSVAPPVLVASPTVARAAAKDDEFANAGSASLLSTSASTSAAATTTATKAAPAAALPSTTASTAGGKVGAAHGASSMEIFGLDREDEDGDEEQEQEQEQDEAASGNPKESGAPAFGAAGSKLSLPSASISVGSGSTTTTTTTTATNTAAASPDPSHIPAPAAMETEESHDQPAPASPNATPSRSYPRRSRAPTQRFDATPATGGRRKKGDTAAKNTRSAARGTHAEDEEHDAAHQHDEEMTTPTRSQANPALVAATPGSPFAPSSYNLRSRSRSTLGGLVSPTRSVHDSPVDLLTPHSAARPKRSARSTQKVTTAAVPMESGSKKADHGMRLRMKK